LVQYDGTDLSGLDSSWRKFISAVREKYHVNVTPPNRGAISTDAYGSDRHIYSTGEVFSKGIRKESDVKPRIMSVWNAGTAVTRAINSKTEILIGRLT
ncbi:MAG: hypothetical protein HY366_01300, partial [Candidatus Aenigmarchaeota archaeon]|nr:hypothetical protein [Candidatus Aenigmarchaeota archaeon]